MIDKYKDYSNERDVGFEKYENSDMLWILDDERKYIVKHLIKWRQDNIESFLYKNGIELLDEAIEMIREGKV
jgi:hypothetical protein